MRSHHTHSSVAVLTCCLTAACTVGLASRPTIAATPAEGLVLNNVTVVDTRTGRLQRGMAVAISGDKIIGVTRAKRTATMPGAAVIDATGKFVVPGYLDMHAHPLNSTGPETSLPLMLANGITGFRQMSGSTEQLQKRRQGQSLTPTASPELLLIPGPVLAGPAVATPEKVAAEIRKQKEDGAEFIKVVDLPAVAYLAALDEARAVRLTVTGHLTPNVDVRDAVKHGMRAVEHLGPTISMVLSCSSDEIAIRQMIAQAPAAPTRIAFDLPPAALKRLTANPMLLTDQNGFALMQHIVSTFDERRCRDLAKFLAGSTMWQVPTLTRLEAMAHGDDDELRHNPNLRLMSAEDRELWKDVGETFSKKLTPSQRQTADALFALQLKLVKVLDTAGVKMVTGTDFGGQWILPGFSLHREFDLLGKSGISPLHVLQMTTINGARFLGRESSMGTVEAGKDANLVLLDANPVTSIQNLHRISAVVRGGAYYSRADLDELVARATTP